MAKDPNETKGKCKKGHQLRPKCDPRGPERNAATALEEARRAQGTAGGAKHAPSARMGDVEESDILRKNASTERGANSTD